MKKMTLVPYESLVSPAYGQQSFNPYFRQTLDTFEPGVRAVKNLQDDMNKLLEDTELSDYDKATFLAQMQGRINTQIKKYRNAIAPQPVLSATSAPPSMAPSAPSVSQITPPPLPTSQAASIPTSEIIGSLAKTHQTKAQHVLNALQRNPDFKVNERHELVIRDQPIHGSNIVDLLLYSTSNRKNLGSLPGTDVFAEQIRESNVPKAFLNPRILQEKHKSSYSSAPPALSPVEYPSSPSSQVPDTVQDWDAFPQF